LKKIFLSVVAAASISTGSFAQEFNGAFFADLAPIIYAASDSGGLGIDFLIEAAKADNYSILFREYAFFNFILESPTEATADEWLWENYFRIGVGIYTRYYPFNRAVSGLFVDFGAGFIWSSVSKDRSENDAGGTESAASSIILYSSAHVGWKFVIGEHFMLEPSIGYGYSLGVVETIPDASSQFPRTDGFFVGFGIGRAW
jgi:hypothetical protein